MNCFARQHSDQMVCPRCALCWDVTDQHPPACLPEPAPPTHQMGPLHLDQRDNTVSVGAAATDLTTQQSAILAAIMDAGSEGVMLERLAQSTRLTSTDRMSAWFRIFEDMETRLALLEVGVRVDRGRVTLGLPAQASAN